MGRDAPQKYRDLLPISKKNVIDSNRSGEGGITWNYYKIFQESIKKGVEIDPPVKINSTADGIDVIGSYDTSEILRMKTR